MASLVTSLKRAIPVALIVVAGPATAQNLLVNPSFESPVIPPDGPPEYAGAGDGWESFGGGIFTVGSAVVMPQEGDQALKMFGGCCSGAFQQFATAPGETWNGGVWIRNDSNDPLSGGQVAAVNIEWIQADGTTQSEILPFISNGEFDATAPRDEWTLQTITGDAPADAAFARFVVITGDFGEGGPGGAPFYDNAFFEQVDSVPTESVTFGRIKALFR